MLRLQDTYGGSQLAELQSQGSPDGDMVNSQQPLALGHQSCNSCTLSFALSHSQACLTAHQNARTYSLSRACAHLQWVLCKDTRPLPSCPPSHTWQQAAPETLLTVLGPWCTASLAFPACTLAHNHSAAEHLYRPQHLPNQTMDCLQALSCMHSAHTNTAQFPFPYVGALAEWKRQ